jgi:hypothetical protein
MNTKLHDPGALQRYREKAAKVGELRGEIGRLVEESKQSGDLERAQNLLEEFTLHSKELKSLQDTLGPGGVFTAKYGVEVINDHTVSFVIPRGYSRLEILEEAKDIVAPRDLILPEDLDSWRIREGFLKRAESSESICIDGHIEETVLMTRSQANTFLRSKGYRPPLFEDLAVAFVVYSVATGRPMFEEYDDDSFKVRSASGVLFNCIYGLAEFVPDYTGDFSDTVSAARIY